MHNNLYAIRQPQIRCFSAAIYYPSGIAQRIFPAQQNSIHNNKL